ncbi:MAG: sulfite exporter TauE/SafE family protein [Pseudomonadota bacterium]
MPEEYAVLILTAASIGFLHTLVGPDHYLPFIVMARARQWSLLKTGWITLLCGFGHVASSVLLGIVGIALGIAVSKLEGVESFRGNLAAWALIAFGLVYFVWGLRKAWSKKSHEHYHAHASGIAHAHAHSHESEHVHTHESEGTASITPWILFTIFVLGPCEPLIPIVMYPAAKQSLSGVVWVTAVFGGITILTMLGIVTASSWGLQMIPFRRAEKYVHALAGGVICLSGLAIQSLGL